MVGRVVLTLAVILYPTALQHAMGLLLCHTVRVNASDAAGAGAEDTGRR